MIEKKSQEQFKNEFSLNPEEMTRAGLHFGHRTSKLDPKMNPYIGKTQNTVHLIDLEKTVEKFTEALKFIQEIVSREGVLLLVGTKIQVKNLVKNIAKECNLPYVSERWLGGTFTNFETMKKRVEYFKDLEQKKEKGELEKYTKKEKIKFEKDLQNLKIKFEGIKNLKELPSAIFVCHMRENDLAVKEARMKGVKVIGIADTNVDPTLADYPIPANDDAISSVKYILDKVKEVILKAKPKATK